MNKTLKIIIVLLSILLSFILAGWLAYKFGLVKKPLFRKKMRYFTYDEFDTKAIFPEDNDKETYIKNGRFYVEGSGEKNMRDSFLTKLDNARHIIEQEWNSNSQNTRIVFSINSGYRSDHYNESLIEQGVPAVPNSSHEIGLAAGINLSGYNHYQLEAIFEALQRVGFNRFGLGHSFVHVDSDKSRPNPAVWDYGTGSISQSYIN